MDTLIKLNNQTAGRDKLARLLQYLSKLLWYRIQQLGTSGGVQGLKNLEYQLSTFRKLLRLGRCLDTLYSTLNVLGHPDSTVRVTVTLSKIASALFLLADHILWMGRADVYNVDLQRWSTISNKYWLYSITMSLLRDAYEISHIVKAEKGRIFDKEGCKCFGDVIKTTHRALTCVRESPDVFVDTVKNLCDFFIPFTALGYAKLSPGTIGLLGVVSSLAGLVTLVEPMAKLTPA